MGIKQIVKSAASSISEWAGFVDPALPETALWAQVGRIGGMLTPATVSQIILEADSGIPCRLVDLLHECRQKDGHLQSTLATRELAIVGLDWSLILPESARARDKKAARLLEEALRNWTDLPLLIAHSVGEGTLFGYAYSELTWGMADGGEALRGLLVPQSACPISSRRFGYRQDDGTLRYILSPGGSPDTDGIDLLSEFPLGKFTAYLPRINGDVRAREGLARVLCWLGLFRNWDMRDWLQYAEIGWKPWRIGKVGRNATNVDKLALQRVMQHLTTTGSAVLPESVEMLIERGNTSVSGSGGSTHKELLEQLGSEMSKAVLGGTLTVDAGSRGARSLGEVHDAVRKDIRDAEALGIGAFLTRYVCEPFIRINFGDNFSVPRLRLNTQEGVDLEKLSKAVSLLAGKVDISQAWVREQGGISEPKPDEPLVVAPSPEPPASDASNEPTQDEAADQAA